MEEKSDESQVKSAIRKVTTVKDGRVHIIVTIGLFLAGLYIGKKIL